MFGKSFLIATALFVAGSIIPQTANAVGEESGIEATSVSDDNTKAVKTIKKGEYVTIFMGREARNITIDWGEGTNCEFDIQISSGHGCYTSVLTGKAVGKGRKTYTYVRTTVEELRIVITKGQGIICNMGTISTKAEDNQSYNPV